MLHGVPSLLSLCYFYTLRLLIEAGAVALGLKTITTRNLALAWRSLQLLLTLMPRINTHFSALLKPAIVEKNIEQVGLGIGTQTTFCVLFVIFQDVFHATNYLLMLILTSVKKFEQVIKGQYTPHYSVRPIHSLSKL